LAVALACLTAFYQRLLVLVDMVEQDPDIVEHLWFPSAWLCLPKCTWKEKSGYEQFIWHMLHKAQRAAA